MSELLKARTSADAWVQAMEHLLGYESGKSFHLLVEISDPCAVSPEFTAVVDELAERFKLRTTMENANSIWPYTLAPSCDDFSTVLDRIKTFAVPVIKEANRRHDDSYVGRLVAWRSRDEGMPFDQLTHLVDRLNAEVATASPKSSAYEVSVFSPRLDAGYMGFPCLSHLSFKLDAPHGVLHLSANYRNHHYVGHAYGNFIGLGRLMSFICRNTGLSPGELLSISTHADAEIKHGRAVIRQAVTKARTVLNGLPRMTHSLNHASPTPPLR